MIESHSVLEQDPQIWGGGIKYEHPDSSLANPNVKKSWSAWLYAAHDGEAVFHAGCENALHILHPPLTGLVNLASFGSVCKQLFIFWQKQGTDLGSSRAL